MGLKEFNDLVKDIRAEIRAHGIDLKSEQLEYEIAREIAKHYSTLKQYDVIQILNEISDNIDSTLNVSENLTIAKQIIDKYLGTDKYNEDYVKSMEEALKHWNNAYASELAQQYLDRVAENSVEWYNILRPQKNPKTKSVVETNSVAKSAKHTTQKQNATVKVVKYKPDLSEIKKLNERVNTLETHVASIDMKLTQFMDMANNNNNKELIEKISNIENGINGLRKDLSTYKEENEAIKAKIAQLERHLAELEHTQNTFKDKQDQLEIMLTNILIAELRDLKRERLSVEYRPTVKNNRPTTTNRQGQRRPRQSKYDILMSQMNNVTNEINNMKKDIVELKTKVDSIEQKVTQPQAQTQTAQQVYNPEKLTLKQKILKFGQEFVSVVTFTFLTRELQERIEVLDKLIQFYRGNQNIILSQKQLQIARDYFDPEKLAWKKKILKFAVAFAPHAGVTPLVKQELKRIEELEKLLQESIKNQNVNQPQNQTQPRATAQNVNQPNNKMQVQAVASVTAK